MFNLLSVCFLYTHINFSLQWILPEVICTQDWQVNSSNLVSSIIPLNRKSGGIDTRCSTILNCTIQPAAAMRSWLNFSDMDSSYRSDIRPLQPTGISSLSAAAASGVWGVLRVHGEELLSYADHAHKRCFPAGGGFLHWYLPGKEKFCHTLSAGVCIRQLVYPKVQLINPLLPTQPWNQCKLMQWAQLCEVTGVVSASCRHTHHVLTIRPTDAGHLHHDVHGDDLGLYQKQRIALLISFILRTAQTIWKKMQNILHPNRALKC